MLVVMDDDGAHICQVTVNAMLTLSYVNKQKAEKPQAFAVHYF